MKIKYSSPLLYPSMKIVGVSFRTCLCASPRDRFIVDEDEPGEDGGGFDHGSGDFGDI